jgi:hypothetical protein
LFGLNIYMQIESEKDFIKLRQHMNAWHRKFPMFRHDVVKIESSVEEHIKQYSIAMVNYRQSHKKNYLEQAQKHIDEINRIIALTEKMELMAILSQG